jgi:hypothetical protein
MGGGGLISLLSKRCLFTASSTGSVLQGQGGLYKEWGLSTNIYQPLARGQAFKFRTFLNPHNRFMASYYYSVSKIKKLRQESWISFVHSLSYWVVGSWFKSKCALNHCSTMSHQQDLKDCAHVSFRSVTWGNYLTSLNFTLFISSMEAISPGLTELLGELRGIIYVEHQCNNWPKESVWKYFPLLPLPHLCQDNYLPSWLQGTPRV